MSAAVEEYQNGEYVKTGEYRTYYHEGGNQHSGTPLILIHGGGPGVSAWANWSDILPSLAKDFHVFAYDVVGFNNSEAPDDFSHGAETYSNQLKTFMDELEIEEAGLVGNSMGGAISLRFVVDCPDRVTKVITLGAAGYPFGEPSEGLKKLMSFQGESAGELRQCLEALVYDNSYLTDEIVQKRYDTTQKEGVMEQFEKFRNDLQSGGSLATDPKRLETIQTPLLITQGREDQVLSSEIALDLFELLDNAELHMFSQCGHWTQIEAKDKFLDQCHVFFSREE